MRRWTFWNLKKFTSWDAWRHSASLKFSKKNQTQCDTYAAQLVATCYLKCEFLKHFKNHLEWKDIGTAQSVTFFNILTLMNIQIYSYQKIYMNEYSNIFILNIGHKRMSEQIWNIVRMSEYIHTNKLDTNECPNVFVKEKLIWTNICVQYIWIFEYSNDPLPCAAIKHQAEW